MGTWTLGSKTLNPDISDKITSRYKNSVKAAEESRRDVFVPLDREELDSTLKKAGVDSVGSMRSDSVLSGVDWSKRLQFLHDHAKTGKYTEKYGTDGVYEGEFLHGMRHGQGRHEFRGEVFEGEWKWDMRHGLGKLSLNDGTVITGDWEAGKQHGFITIVDPQGVIVFEGEFRRGKRHGLGRQLFERGDMYDGCWCDGRLHDRGVYYFTNGDKLLGMWKHGVYDGVGVFHYADGSVSRRTYSEGRLMSVQDYESSSQRFGKNLHRKSMLRHTMDDNFPREIFMLDKV